MDVPATYLHWGFISISLPNLLLIVGMVVLFGIAIVAPFPKHRRVPVEPAAPDAAVGIASDESNWTRRLRQALAQRWPWHTLLPDRQPSYVASWVYVFGVGAIAALLWIIGSGMVLVFFGPAWWHQTGAGRFVNSIHFWSVQAFFVCTVIHLWGKYFMASWRHGRALTWIVGVVVFAVSIAEAFTGYLSQQNFDAQWIAVNAKDAINSTGFGAFFNVLDYGQMFGLHVMLLPLAVVTLVAVHIALVRLHGVVRPIGWREPAQGDAELPEVKR
jgi:ubiquinol-cytochrome c reductase cytochrome b subunit